MELLLDLWRGQWYEHFCSSAVFSEEDGHLSKCGSIFQEKSVMRLGRGHTLPFLLTRSEEGRVRG